MMTHDMGNPKGSNPAFFVSHEAHHDVELDQIVENCIVIDHPIPL